MLVHKHASGLLQGSKFSPPWACELSNLLQQLISGVAGLLEVCRVLYA